MLPTDFLDNSEDAWGNYARRLDLDMLQVIRAGPHPTIPDAEAGTALAQLVHDQLTACGTSGGHELTDAEIRKALAALRALCDRLGVPYTVPFGDFAGFKAYWQRKGASGSGGWAAKRALLAEVFDPMHEQLEALEAQALAATLATPITTHPGTGWPAVDHEIAELRRQFLTALTAQDYNAVGLVAVRLTEALSATVYDPNVHLRPGETVPPVSNTKDRLDRYIEHSAPGPDDARLRKLARDSIEYAQHVKHRGTPTRREAGIAADAALLLANILRRLTEP
ncbi:MAG: oxygenase MpaB family protein [Acidimicrobiales bacterium]